MRYLGKCHKKLCGATVSKNQTGFTLIELLVTIAIIGILSAIGIITLMNARERARDTKRRADLNSVRLALELYYDAQGAYPSHETFLGFSGFSTTGNVVYDALVGQSKYIGSLPQAPLVGEEYFYASCADPEGRAGADYTLYTVLENPTLPGRMWAVNLRRGTSQEELTPGCPQI